MQETADKSNRLKNSLPEDNLVKQENIKIHGIGLDKAGRLQDRNHLPADLLLPLFPLPAHQVQDGFRIPNHRPLQTGSSLCLH